MNKNASAAKAIGEIKKHLQNVQKTAKLWVACSGGADSLALAYSLYRTVHDKSSLGAIVVDHQMQQGSEEVTKTAMQTLKKIGYETIIVQKVQVSGQKNKENAAREARYAAFIDAVNSQDKHHQHIILTAHTKNDQAESVLLGLARGSGMQNLSGIPVSRKITDNITILRPFLNVTRMETEEICKTESLDFWTDPTNGVLGVENTELPLRSQIRNTIIPYLKRTLNPQIVDALTKTAEIASENKAALSKIVETAKEDVMQQETHEKIVLSALKLARLSPAIRKNTIKQCADSINMSTRQATTKKQVDSIDSLVTNWHGQKPIILAGAVVFREAGKNEIVFHKADARK